MENLTRELLKIIALYINNITIYNNNNITDLKKVQKSTRVLQEHVNFLIENQK